ncbi:hypothetical protein D3C86_1581020 [compost metagenome]
MFWRFNVFGQLFGFAFYELVVEENTDQRARFAGVRQRNEALIFEFQRFVAAKACGGFDGFHGGNRCRIVFACRLHHHAFGDGEAHGGFNFAEFQRLELRLAFGFPVEIALNRLT